MGALMFLVLVPGKHSVTLSPGVKKKCLKRNNNIAEKNLQLSGKRSRFSYKGAPSFVIKDIL